jgi:dTDP-4-dehydrorhamnose reductase
MLGQDVVRVLRDAGEDVTGLDRAEADITDPVALEPWLDGADVVVNCAAWTAVDAAETAEADAFTVNAVGAATLARGAARHGVRLVHVSTDYVFDGRATSPYPEGAPQRPRSAYGRTKAAGEWAVAAAAPDHLVVRTAWLYGAGGPCFPATVQKVLRERGSMQVVDDQVGQPTWTVDLARFVLALVRAGVPSGSYHGTSSGQASWYEFAGAVAAAAGLDPALVTPTTSESFVRPAPRPAYSVLGHDAAAAAGVAPIGDWRERWEEAAASVLAPGAGAPEPRP